MASSPFVHLHLHTEYSLLDGAVRIGDLMKKVVRSKMPAVAMTDHGNLFGAIDFYKQARKHEVKPIIGCEVYLAPGSMNEKKKIPGRENSSHLTLLSKNYEGYANLVRLVSKAHLEGNFQEEARIDKEQLANFSEGLICLSGCINGEINQLIRAGQIDQARASLEEFVAIYGKDDFYLELHDHGLEEQAKCTEQLLSFADHYDLKVVAANDVHFLNKSNHEAHDVMICIGEGANVFDENRKKYSPEVYFKSTTEMGKLFRQIPQALESTLEIAEKCNLEISLDSTSSERYPQYDSPDGSPRDEFFRKLCWSGLEDRYGKERADSDKELHDRLEYEMGIMEKMGFVSYFLITWDFIKWARDNGIPVGPGRGSAAGSLVAYCMEITDLDPIRFGLIFERFLNPERVSPPDVDVDFCQSRRGEVIEYVRQKYGERCVSHIITFGTMGAKSVIRDVGRVLGMGYNDTDRIAKMVPAELGITLAKARQKNPELKEAIEGTESVAQLWQYATFLEGLTRGVGIHAAGIVIGDCDLDMHIPLTRGNEEEVVTQYAMKPLTDLGMLKMDFLGLKTLTVIQDAVSLIQLHTPDFTIGKASLDDGPTFELLNAGETCGVFQLESGGMVALCRQFGVDRIEDIIALIALYRPGPMDLIPDFIDRKKGKKKVVYEHPLLEDVSRETHGILIYQEQVQKAANVLAGYSLGDADLLRRAMGKKDPAEMAKQRDIFVEGCKRVNNIKDKLANSIFDLLEKFAGYGFNKSHSAAYGLISYQTAYLKANYPVEFMSALLSNEINNTDKISVFVNECQTMGITILPPDVNRSYLKFAPEAISDESKAIRFGLAAVKNVGGAAMDTAIKEREDNGEFKTVDDFASRLDSKSVNRKILESLNRAGAFDFSGEKRASIANRLEHVISSASAAQRDRKSGQESLFDTMDFAAAPPSGGSSIVGKEEIEEWPKDQMLDDEKELLGFYVTGHPLDTVRELIESARFKRISDLQSLEPNKRKKHRFAGLLSAVGVRYTKKGGKPFAILSLEDFTGITEVMVWNEVYMKRSSLLEKGAVVEVTANVEEDMRSESNRLTAVDVKILDPNASIPEERPEDVGGYVHPAIARQREEQAAALEQARNEAAARHNPEFDRIANSETPPWETAGSAEPSGFSTANGPPNVSPFVLVLELGSATPADLEAIYTAVRAHPGKTPLELQFRSPGGDRVAHIAASTAYGVDGSSALAQTLSKWNTQ